MAYDQDKIGVIVNPDQTLRILCPAPDVLIVDEFQRLGITGGSIVLRSDKPTTTVLFPAWRLNPTENKIYIDVEKAKEIVIGENEKVAKRQLVALRPAFEEAYDMDDQFTLDLVKFDRQNIRNDLTIRIANINACTTAAQVETYLP